MTGENNHMVRGEDVDVLESREREEDVEVTIGGQTEDTVKVELKKTSCKLARGENRPLVTDEDLNIKV